MSGHFLTLRSKRLKIICVVLEFASIIQYPLLLISPSPKVIPLPPCAVLSWHHFIKSSITVPFLGNRIGWVQLLFKLLLLSLPRTYKSWSSSTKGSNEYNLLFCLTFGSFYCLLNLLSFSSANALLFAIVVFFPPISISAMLRSCSDVPICGCSSVLSLFGMAFLILSQFEKCVSNVSSISVFTSVLLTKTSFLVSGWSVSMSFTVWSLFHDDSGSQRNFGPSYHVFTFAKQVLSNPLDP